MENDFFTKRGSCTYAGFKKQLWVIILSFHAVSALLFGGSVTLVLCFTPYSSREPSTAALLGPLITGGVFRTSYVFPEKSHKADLAVILSYVFIEARSDASRAAQPDSDIIWAVEMTESPPELQKRWAFVGPAIVWRANKTK